MSQGFSREFQRASEKAGGLKNTSNGFRSVSQRLRGFRKAQEGLQAPGGLRDINRGIREAPVGLKGASE